jgi:hypothetical protein
MMKRTILAFVILFVIAGQTECYSEDTSSEYLTMGFFNGRMWSMMNKTSKDSYVAGVYSGAVLFRDVVINQQTCTAKIVNETFNSTIQISRTKYGEIAQQIDSFYSDSSNLRIPIHNAYEFRGESPSKIEEYTAQLRKFYNK